jgi:transcriptional regulator with XRE-family HTH domain
LLSATIRRPELDPAATLRELREYLALSYEASHRIAQRIGITVVTFNNFLSGKRTPQQRRWPKSEPFLGQRQGEVGLDYGRDFSSRLMLSRFTTSNFLPIEPDGLILTGGRSSMLNELAWAVD